MRNQVLAPKWKMDDGPLAHYHTAMINDATIRRYTYLF